EQGVRLPVGGGFAGRIAATGKPYALERVDRHSVLNPLLIRRGIRSMLGAPMLAGGKTVGVLHVGTLHPRIFDEAEIHLLQLVADRVALAVQARRQHENDLIAQTLQRSLLPERLPDVAGIEIAGLYRPAAGGLVGGDWYDVFVLGKEELFVVIGDVAGRGLASAIAMSRLRNAVRALAFADRDPAATLGHVNEFLIQFDPRIMATMIIGALLPDGSLRLASAGHPPPVVVNPQSHAALLEFPADPPLGAVDGYKYEEHSVTLEAGSTLIAYTDGLVERRGQSLTVGLENLRAAAETPWSNLDALSRLMFEGDGLSPELGDDLAMIALHLRGIGHYEEIHVRIGGEPRELSALRSALRRWLVRCGADRQLLQDILVAVSEAAANSIEHGYASSEGKVTVDGAVVAGDIVISVTDQGAWGSPGGIGRGLGRSLMAALMDDVSVETSDAGTVVTLRTRLRS
ncbi:MAG: ATP-binding SpoIIE family protein phosphatase, partial [Actinomycetota bacterium]